MRVQMTNDLRQQLSESDVDPYLYLQAFTTWRELGGGEDDHFWFGKDGAYDRPRSSINERILKHVHLAPDEDTSEYQRWTALWERHGRRTSDTILVYADGGRHGFLMIAILWAPEAHQIAEMRTKETRYMMEGFAAVAERFIYDGTFEA